jgi:hypothetical protein
MQAGPGRAGPPVWLSIGSVFASNKAYKNLIGHHQIPPTFNWLWNSTCQNKRKIFLLALLRRRNMRLEDCTCVLCHLGVREELIHLLFQCSFAATCWNYISIAISSSTDLQVIIQSLKDQLRVPFFMEIIVTMCWSIWMMRNDVIFRGQNHSFMKCSKKIIL